MQGNPFKMELEHDGGELWCGFGRRASGFSAAVNRKPRRTAGRLR
jgi:hypothetical protein